jgi:hypothetical protein
MDMKIRTSIKAGGRRLNHNETLVGSGLKTRTALKAGYICGVVRNHNETLVRVA